MSEAKIINGGDAAILGAQAGGAEFFYGYPITPTTEILEGWIQASIKNKNLQYLQTEDEIAAGFALIGSLLAGKKAFTATAGVGHVLMQDPMSMAENMRLPFVAIIGQRGGPSTGTVIYSQQEVNLACFGGNGDGLRIVYSASTISEIYMLSAKIFSTAWKYRFPTTLLIDGYLSKAKTKVDLPKLIKPYPASKILKEDSIKPTHLRNCYGSESEFAKVLDKNISDFENLADKVSEYEFINPGNIKTLIISHGSVAAATKTAIENVAGVGLFRPITLRPFAGNDLQRIANKVNKIIILESAYDQLSRIVSNEICDFQGKIITVSKPAEGFTPEEIVKILKEKS